MSKVNDDVTQLVGDMANMRQSFAMYRDRNMNALQQLQSRVEANQTTIADLNAKLATAAVDGGGDVPPELQAALDAAHAGANELVAAMAAAVDGAAAPVVPVTSGDAAPLPDAPPAPDAAASTDV